MTTTTLIVAAVVILVGIVDFSLARIQAECAKTSPPKNESEN